MPFASKRPCATVGCGALVAKGHCDRHRGNRYLSDRARGTATQRGYDSRWEAFRRIYLAQHPLCVECQSRGLTKAAYAVDHIKPHRGDTNLFWDNGNLQALCRSCHNSKSAKERLTTW